MAAFPKGGPARSRSRLFPTAFTAASTVTLTAALTGAVAIHVLFALLIWKGNPAYFGHYRAQIHPDAQHYVLLAENFWQGRGFSRMDVPPYQPDALRTPGYIAVAGPLWLLAHAVWPLYLFNAFCHLATALLVYRLGRVFLGRGPALAAAGFFALDLVLISMTFETMSEPLFNLLWVLGAVLFLTGFSRFRNGKGGGVRIACAGLALGLATLVRPTGLYAPLALTLAALVCMRARRDAVPTAKALALFLPAFLMVLLPWMARNQKTFGIFRLSTVDAINLVYYAGAGPYQLEYGLGLPQAQEKISRDYGLASNLEYHNPWQQGKSIRQLDGEIRAVTGTVLLRDPLRLMLSTAIGVCRSAIAHTTDLLSEMTGRHWIAPGLSRLAAGKPGEFLAQLGRNPAWAVAVFFTELSQAILLWLLFLIGAVSMGARFLRGERMLAAALLLCAYFQATMGAGGMDATARFRTAILPLAYIVAVEGALSALAACRRYGKWAGGGGFSWKRYGSRSDRQSAPTR